MKSTPDRDQAEQSSVFDFIYVDQQRISQLLTQFNETGFLTEILDNKSAGRQSRKSDRHKVGGSALFLKGDSEIAADYSAHHEGSVGRKFDPKWVNALNFLDELQSRGLLQREISEARIGQIGLAFGSLKIRDLGALREIWNKPSVIAAFQNHEQEKSNLSRQQRKAKNRAVDGKSSSLPPEQQLFFDLVDTFPHTVQAIVGTEPKTWGILESQSLLGFSTDFALKFGGKIQGSWAMVGIVEALPDESINPSPFETKSIDEVADAMIAHLAPLSRQLLGRPSDAFGVTPLMIFREVSN